MPHFVDSVEEIRHRAERKIDDGAVTEAYELDREETVDILNEALATEIVCVLRYMHHYFMATGVHGMGVRDEFKEHADAEREHADRIAERIQQLGGKPDFNPRHLLERSASQYVEGESLADMIREDLIAERVVIEVYNKMIRHFGDRDPVTRRMIEEILKDEEEHASDLSDLLYVVDPRTGETEGEDPGVNPLRNEGGDGKQAARGRERQQQRRNSPLQREPDEALEALSTMKGSGSQGGPSRRNATPENRPSRAAQRERPQAGAIPPAHQPGASGRPTRKRSQDDEVDLEVADSVGQAGGGTNRSVHITRPNRKGRRVA